MNHVKEITEAHIRDVDANYIASLEEKIATLQNDREQLFTVINSLDSTVLRLLECGKRAVAIEVNDEYRRLQRLREAFPYRTVIDAEKVESQIRIGTNCLNIDSIHG